MFVLLVMPVPLRAHHSQALARYDADHPATLNGMIVEVRLINPHSVLVFDVTAASGQAERWRAELPAAVALHKAGWTEDALKYGDHVTIVGAPAKDGAKEIGLLHESRVTNTDTGTVVYDAGRPVWLSIYRFLSR
jgi:hypothetical protein